MNDGCIDSVVLRRRALTSLPHASFALDGDENDVLAETVQSPVRCKLNAERMHVSGDGDADIILKGFRYLFFQKEHGGTTARSDLYE